MPKRKLTEVHVRLFNEDISLLKKVAEERGLSWGTELRLLVNKTLKSDFYRRELLIIKEQR